MKNQTRCNKKARAYAVPAPMEKLKLKKGRVVTRVRCAYKTYDHTTPADVPNLK